MSFGNNWATGSSTTGTLMIVVSAPSVRVSSKLILRRQHGDTTCDREPRVRLSHEAHRVEVFYIRELVSEGKMTIHYVSTEDNLADIGTKHLTKQRLQQLLHTFKNF